MRRWSVGLALACATVLLTASGCSTAGDSSGSTQRFKVITQEYKFSPANLTFEAGKKVELVVINKGQLEHEFEAEIDGEEVEKHVKPGKQIIMTFTPKKAQNTKFWCAIGKGSHRKNGMEGDIQVR